MGVPPKSQSVLVPHTHLGHGTATVFTRYFGRMLVRNTYLRAPPLQNINVIFDLHWNRYMLHSICSDSPMQSQTAICDGKDNSVAVVCVAKLGWREQMISDE